MRTLFMAATALAFAAGCAPGTTVGSDRSAVASVSVSLPSGSLAAGESERAVAVVKDANGAPLTDRTVEWRTSDNTVATVDAAGTVVAVDTGVVTITAVAEAVAGQAPLSVRRAPVATVTVSPNSSTIQVGGSAQLSAATLAASGRTLRNRVIAWSSSNNGVATVSANGVVSAVGVGGATITASSEGVNGTAAVNVVAQPLAPVASVVVTPATSSVVAGATLQLQVSTRDANGAALSGRTITWSSSNTSVATVSAGGLVSAAAAGSATITATSEGKSGSAGVTVTAPPPVPVASVSVTPASSSIQAGATAQLSATTRDANGATLNGRTVTWSSSNTGAATVSSSGLVTAIAAGSATITATSEGKTGTAAVTVSAPPPVPVASVVVSPATASTQVGATVQLSAATRDANGGTLTGRSVTWGSSNNAIATVTSAGLVKGIAAGSATITATSEGKNGTSAVTVTAVTTATPIFSDDFETGDLTKWDESNSTTQKVIRDAASAHGGTYFLRMTYGINGMDGGWLHKYFFAHGYSTMYVRYYVRFSNNFAGGTKLISFRGGPIGQPYQSVGRAGICPNGRDGFSANLVTDYAADDGFPTKMYTYWQDMWADGDGKCWGRYGATPSTLPYVSPMPVLSRGVWHKIEFTMKMNSGANVADGEQRFWIDGVLYGEWKNIRWGDPAYVDLEALQINGSGNTTQLQSLDMDDLVLYSQYQSASQP